MTSRQPPLVVQLELLSNGISDLPSPRIWSLPVCMSLFTLYEYSLAHWDSRATLAPFQYRRKGKRDGSMVPEGPPQILDADMQCFLLSTQNPQPM